MKTCDKERFLKVAVAALENFNRPADSESVSALWLFLKDLPIESVERALLSCVREERFMPSVAEIRQRCGQETPDSIANKAWVAVSEAAGSIGSYRSVNFADPVINATIRTMGGWPELLSRCGDDFDKWARQEFVRIYKSLAGRVGLGSELGSALSGLGTIDRPPEQVQVSYGTTAIDQRRLLSRQGDRSDLEASESLQAALNKIGRDS